MRTSAKIGFARQQYGRDRADIQLDMADLPDILTEYGVDEAGYKRMPFSARYKALRLEAEIIAKTVYYEHEAADARREAAPGQQLTLTAAMTALRREVPELKAKRDALLAPYKAGEPATA
jgi:hypothetical protein